MAALAWLVAPRLAHWFDGPAALPRALILALLAGLVWQFLLVLTLVHRERRSLRWSVVKDALWLHAPRRPSTGRRGGRMWLIVIPLIVALAAEEMIPALPTPVTRGLGVFLGSDDGRTFLSGDWGWLGVIVALQIFNTVLGEELLFRGLLLPRMAAGSAGGTGPPTACSSRPTTCTCRGRSRRRCSTRSSWPTRPGVTAARPSASLCTVLNQ